MLLTCCRLLAFCRYDTVGAFLCPLPGGLRFEISPPAKKRLPAPVPMCPYIPFRMGGAAWADVCGALLFASTFALPFAWRFGSSIFFCVTGVSAFGNRFPFSITGVSLRGNVSLWSLQRLGAVGFEAAARHLRNLSNAQRLGCLLS